MATIKVWTFADAAVATEFSGGASFSTGNLVELAAGKFHARITGHTTALAQAHDLFAGGTAYDAAVLGIQNWKITPAFTASGDATTKLEVVKLLCGGPAYTQAGSVYLRKGGKMYLHVAANGGLSATSLDSPDSTTTLGDTEHDLEVWWDRATGDLTLVIDGTDTAATLTGLTGGSAGVDRVALGCVADAGTAAWTATYDIYADEMTIDSDKTARPYSGGGGAAPAVPSGLVPAGLDDLEASVTFSTPGGHRIVIKAGADQADPGDPTAAGWTTVTPTDGSSNPSTTSSGGTTVSFALPANDTRYTARVFSYDGSLYSTTSVATNVFSMAPMAFVALTPAYVVGQIATNLDGLPRFEFNSSASWVRGGADSGTFDAHTDGTAGYTLFGPAVDFTDTNNGDALPIGDAAGWGPGKSGYRVRLDFTGIQGTPYVTGYHGADGT